MVDLDAYNERDPIEGLQRAVAAGERLLGAKLIDDNKGNIWLLVEACQYVRPLKTLALRSRSTVLTGGCHQRCGAVTSNRSEEKFGCIGLVCTSTPLRMAKFIALDSKSEIRKRSCPQEFSDFVLCLLSVLLQRFPSRLPNQYSGDERGATISDDRMQTRVEFWREDLVRITHRPSRPMNPSASMSVIAKPESVQWRLAESEKFEDLSTARLTVSIDRQSGTVRIFNSSHDELVSEEPNGTWLSSADVGSAKETIASRQKFALDPDESIFGLGQHPEAGSMDLVGKSLKLLQENMHVSVPVMLSSKGYVLFWDNPAVTQVDVGKADPHSMEWQSEAGSGVDYYVALGPEPDHAIAGYRWLTGEAPLFPRWAWGFWQSRERYKTQAEILDIVSQYRQRHIPLDGIVQDWQYWAPLNQETAANGWGSHIFDASRYPDPAGMIKTLHEEHAHLMIVSWAKFDVTNSGVSIPNLKELEAVGYVELSPGDDNEMRVFFVQRLDHARGVGVARGIEDVRSPSIGRVS